MSFNESELIDYLRLKADEYEVPHFIEDDPIQIPKQFHSKEDIEIAGFLTAIIAWGNRKSIISSAEKMIEYMGCAPFEFIVNHNNTKDFEGKSGALHRTFMWEDFQIICKCLKALYNKGASIEKMMSDEIHAHGLKEGLWMFKQNFLGECITNRVQKHLPNPMKGSAAKRINMYLRWMVRSKAKGVDFGIWSSIPKEALFIPLDVHTGNIARALGITSRKQNDWKTLEEIMIIGRKAFPVDPAKLDFALFGLGVSNEVI